MASFDSRTFSDEHPRDREDQGPQGNGSFLKGHTGLKEAICLYEVGVCPQAEDGPIAPRTTTNQRDCIAGLLLNELKFNTSHHPLTLGRCRLRKEFCHPVSDKGYFRRVNPKSAAKEFRHRRGLLI